MSSTPKLVLSKKGFDSTNGGGPSPILADDRMVSLPIPEPREGVWAATYRSLTHDHGTYGDLLSRLGYSIGGGSAAHLDPDLIHDVRPRQPGRRGMFGQVDSAETHLVNQGVGSGSLFLFWGWFDREGSSRPFRRSKGFSAIFGYLEVESVVAVGTDPIPSDTRYHPHFHTEYPRERNRVYVARESLSWDRKKPGWGVFHYSEKELRLSVPGLYRRNWRLPGCFHPDNGCVLSHNETQSEWGQNGSDATVRIPARGQEFVSNLDRAVFDWAQELVDNVKTWSPKFRTLM
jgi:hypothetical protein